MIVHAARKSGSRKQGFREPIILLGEADAFGKRRTKRSRLGQKIKGQGNTCGRGKEKSRGGRLKREGNICDRKSEL